MGYPSGSGSFAVLESFPPVAIRKNATTEEKEVAIAFIKMLLSYDTQKSMSSDTNFFLSVRSDVLEEQIQSVDSQSYPYVSGFEQRRLGDLADYEKDSKLMYSLIESAHVKRGLSKELSDVLAEEFSLFFNDEIDEKTLIDHLENRVGMYISEKQ